MFIAKYIFPVLLFLCASNSYGEITKEKVERFYESIVSARSIVPPEAKTAASFGVEREGNGMAIDEKHILTVGYIFIESESMEIGLYDGRRLPAKLIVYDHTSGFGIIKSVVPLTMPPPRLGNSDNINSEQDLLLLPSPNRGAGSIVTIDGSHISNFKSFYEKVWRSGEAAVTIELSVLHGGSLMNLKSKNG